MQQFIKTHFTYFLIAIATASCTNGGSSKFLSNLSGGSGAGATSTGVNNLIENFGTYTISTVVVSSSTSGSGGAAAVSFPVQINFVLNAANGSSTPTVSLLNSCSQDLTSAPCLCQFTWVQLNTTTNPPTSINHVVNTPLTSVQAAQANCNTPSIWTTSIPDGTQVGITVVPASGNNNSFNVNQYVYTVGQNPQTGDFNDSLGNSYIDILRYTCYDQRQRGVSLTSRAYNWTAPYTVNGSALPAFNYYSASKYCLEKADGSMPVTQGCNNMTPAYSTQSYYYNLYIRDTQVGDINSGNAAFICPMVNQGLNTTTGGTSASKYWPLDSTFALSLVQTAQFTIGVTTNSVTSNTNDPSAVTTYCNGATATPGSPNSLIGGCLGFAAPANSDGTCPALAGPAPSYSPIQTYRLRRYYALYPSIWDTNGNWISNQQQLIDTVYVVDRPVVQPSPSPSPFTMLGPKPCPFAWFDKATVTNDGIPASLVNGVYPNPVLANPPLPEYLATNNSGNPSYLGSSWGWAGQNNTGVNVDGTQFPNVDSGTTGAQSCSAVLPLPDASMSSVTLGTINASNPDPRLKQRFVRPLSPWSAHYEEDKTFKACAPLSNHFVDPPLHFAQNVNNGVTNTAWCAEVYPTQNPYIMALDPPVPIPNTTPTVSKATGLVRPFTSHNIKGVNPLPASCTDDNTVVNSAVAAGNTLSTNQLADHNRNDPNGLPNPNYPGTAGALASATCDRTVTAATNGVAYPQFPMLAPAADVEAALQNDPSFSCLVSYDGTTMESNSIQREINAANGTAPPAGSSIAGIQSPAGGCCANVNGTTAHLEPGSSCTQPKYNASALQTIKKALNIN